MFTVQLHTLHFITCYRFVSNNIAYYLLKKNTKTKIMKLKLLIYGLLTFFSITTFGKQIDENTARTVGQNFLITKPNASASYRTAKFQMVYKSNLSTNSSNTTFFYVFNVATNGFVIVAGDDTVTPILGYSTEGNFDSNSIPQNVAKWLEGYKNEIRTIVEQNIQPSIDIKENWKRLRNGDKINTTSQYRSDVTSKIMLGVAPLIRTEWDQSPFYNALCPTDAQANQKTVTGCVATAMAQIMKYWNYPVTGSGNHSYNHDKYGKISANFANTTYQWSAMSSRITSSNNAVATLMYHCGVSVDMNYGPALSGAAGATSVQPALVKYFGYQNSNIALRSNYTESQWINLLKSELDAGRPMYYEGTGNGSGHAFVCDGYDANNYFHFNWGWSGNSDGNYIISALNPIDLGTGAGNGQYNSNQKIVKGIQPPTSAITYNLSLNNNLTPSTATISYGSPFSVSTNIKNSGANTFTGDYTIGIFDSNGNFIDYLETKANNTLEGGYTYSANLVFSNPGLLSMLPGNYTLGLYYRPTDGEWKIVQNSGSYTNFTQVTVVNTNPIKLNSIMAVSPSTTLTKGQSASVNLNIVNSGTSTFVGQYKVGLYNLDGTFVQDIAIYNEASGLPVNYTYTAPFLTFSTSSITSSPGSYLIALQHKSAAGNWELTGSTSTFINPVNITVITAPLLADIYEDNNTFAKSYSLPVTFTGNNASVKTAGSNAHIGTDTDYYKMVLPTGFNYTVTPRLQDSYNSNNGTTYTLDALFAYSTDGVTWSEAFDDVITGNITINNGGTVYFKTAPYFQGNTGNYLLDVSVARTQVPSKIVISQVYGGGGNSGAPYTNDYIELFNGGTVAQNLGGWSVQCTSATGPTTTWFPVNLPDFTLQPGQYYLIQGAGGAVGSALPTANVISTASLGATAGKVILVNSTTAETAANPTGSQIIDKVAYGASTAIEGTPTVALSNTTVAIRNLDGCTDTDNNVTDFSVGTPLPRNSSSAFNLCSSLSVSQNKFETFTLYPNPTKSKVLFDNSIPTFENVSIFNYLGQEVSKSTFSSFLSTQEVDMSKLSTGVYMLKFSNQKGDKTVKVIKE